MAADERIPNLIRWLTLGLVIGAAVIGVAIGAYEVGYHRGKHHGRVSAAQPTATTSATTAPATTASTATIAATPAVIARGKQLYSADGCSACHTLTGAATVGPSLKGLAGKSVVLATGQSVTADDPYLERSITSPDAQIVKGYHPGLMAPAISSHHLAAQPNDVRALVAFIKSQK